MKESLTNKAYFDKFGFILILIFSSLFCAAQKGNSVYEQTGFNYFIDSVFKKNYPGITLIYYKPKINPTLSLMRQPLGFKDYLNKRDSAEALLLREELDSIKELDCSSYNIESNKRNGLDIYELPENKNKIKWKKSIRIEVFKRTIAKPDFYVVELVVMSQASRTHFFVEISKAKNYATRWYKIQYYFSS